MRWNDTEAFRPNVAALVRCEGRILLCQRMDLGGWQTVQGGLEREDASPESAIVREMVEELGVEPGDVTLLRRSACWRRYRFPPHAVRAGDGYVGQEQLWFEVALERLACVRLERSTGEFRAVKLGGADELVRLAVEWKRPVFLDFLREIGEPGLHFRV